MKTKSTRRPRLAGGETPAAHPPEPPRAAAERPAPESVVRVSRRETARAVDRCADSCTTTETRSTIHAVARAVLRGRTPLGPAVAACLDDADAAGADRWHAAEAATWGLARLARGAGDAAADGRQLERLVGLARGACDSLRERDTRAARFVVVLARLFADVEACRELEPAAASAIREEVGRLTTEGGTVGLAGSAAVVERIARWTDVRAAVAALGGSSWDDDTERRWMAAATGGLRVLGGKGRRLGERASVPHEPFVDALARDGRARVRRTASHVRRARGRTARLLAPDLHDPAAATTIIRTGWERDAVRVLLDYRGTSPRLEIAAGDRLLVDGDWEWGVDADGRSLEAEGPWTVAGWEAGRNGAFLEITAPLAGGMRLERHVAVLRRQRIVLLADAVKPAASDAGVDALAVRSALTLAAGLEAEPAAETREVLVYDGDMRLLALPPALPEWRGVGPGGLAVHDGRLVLEQVGRRRLYAPLWLDCDPRRIGRPLTWRQLTVADTRRNLPPHQAAGFRVQAGSEQWLLYRALDVSRNRSLLGCNVSSEFLLGRVKRSGEVARTIEIE